MITRMFCVAIIVIVIVDKVVVDERRGVVNIVDGYDKMRFLLL